MSIESVKYSLRNLKQSKARSFLTILSIFVGIATIFIFISFGWGLYDYIDEFTSSSSADKLIIQAKGSGATGLDDTFALTDSDLRSIEKSTGVYAASGVTMKVAEVSQGSKSIYTFVASYDPKEPLIMEVSSVDIYDGRWLNAGDDGKVLLGYNYQFDNLIFPNGYEINDKITINNQDLRIVGFIEEIGNPTDDSSVYINNDFLDTLYPNDKNSYSMIIARINTEDIARVVENVERGLRKNRDLEKGKEDFTVQSFEELLASYGSALNMVIAFIVLIALMSVFVSAVNTANTMITSVLERYKEIGIIKAIGARNSEVLGIFLFESAFLGFVAGVIGVAVGGSLSYLSGVALDSLGWGFLSPHFSATLFIGCILFATITGAISGIAPAIRASKTNTVDALRYE